MKSTSKPLGQRLAGHVEDQNLAGRESFPSRIMMDGVEMTARSMLKGHESGRNIPFRITITPYCAITYIITYDV